jgi:hypothetical protein
LQVAEAVRFAAQDCDCDLPAGDALLMREAAIHRDQHVEATFDGIQQASIAEARNARVSCRLHIMLKERVSKLVRQAFVQ